MRLGYHRPLTPASGRTDKDYSLHTRRSWGLGTATSPSVIHKKIRQGKPVIFWNNRHKFFFNFDRIGVFFEIGDQLLSADFCYINEPQSLAQTQDVRINRYPLTHPA